MIYLYLVFVAATLFCLFMATIRNDVVYKARTAAIDLVYEGRDWRERRKLFTSADSYEKMIWQFSKWKVEDFFPELVKAAK